MYFRHKITPIILISNNIYFSKNNTEITTKEWNIQPLHLLLPSSSRCIECRVYFALRVKRTNYCMLNVKIYKFIISVRNMY